MPQSRYVPKVGDVAAVATLGKDDPCWMLLGAHTFGFTEAGDLLQPLIIRVTHLHQNDGTETMVHQAGLYQVCGILLRPNLTFGWFEGTPDFDEPNPGNQVAVDDFLHRLMGEGDREPISNYLFPEDRRPRRNVEVGGEVAFRSAELRPSLALV